MRLLRLIGLSLWLACAAASLAQANSGPVAAGDLEISIDSRGGLPNLPGGNLRLRWLVPGDIEATRALRELHYDAVAEETSAGLHTTLTSREFIDGRQLIQNYYRRRSDGPSGGSTLHLDLDLPVGAAIELFPEAGFVPEPLPGFGAIYGKVLPVIVDAQGQRVMDTPGTALGEHSLAPADWFGIRNRFRAGLLHSETTTLRVGIDARADNLPRLVVMPPRNAARLQLELYAGPVDANRLAAVDAKLTGMMYAALWNWLRTLCFGMSWLLTGLHTLVGNVGLAIILLSVCVKILLLPLTMIADRWQNSVNKINAILQPQIDAIKSVHKGEEAHNRILDVYRENNVHPLYAVKSLAGFLILIPVFIAAFDVLGENFLLNGTSFLWIEDLAKPDRALPLPWELPFFGAALNLLPFLMTGVTLLTSWLQTDPSLSPQLLRKQRSRLYLMAAAFFLLFYTFPAGMVMYWTMNNVLHLLKILGCRLRNSPQLRRMAAP